MAINRFSSPTQYQYQSTFRALPVEQIGEIAMQMQQKQDTVKKEIQTYANNADLLASTVGGGDVAKVKDFASGVRSALQQAVDESGGVLTSNDFSFKYNQVMKNASAQAGEIKEMQDAFMQAKQAETLLADDSMPEYKKFSIANQLKVYNTEGKEGVKRLNAAIYGQPAVAFSTKVGTPVESSLMDDLGKYRETYLGPGFEGVVEDALASQVGMYKKGNNWVIDEIPDYYYKDHGAELRERAMWELSKEGLPISEDAVKDRELSIYARAASNAVEANTYLKATGRGDGGGSSPSITGGGYRSDIIDIVMSNEDGTLKTDTVAKLAHLDNSTTEQKEKTGASNILTITSGKTKVHLASTNEADLQSKDAVTSYQTNKKIINNSNFAFERLLSSEKVAKGDTAEAEKQWYDANESARRGGLKSTPFSKAAAVAEGGKKAVNYLRAMAKELGVEQPSESLEYGTAEYAKEKVRLIEASREAEEAFYKEEEALIKRLEKSEFKINELDEFLEELDDFSLYITGATGSYPVNVHNDRNKRNVDYGTYSSPAFAMDIVLDEEGFGDMLKNWSANKPARQDGKPRETWLFEKIRQLRTAGVDVSSSPYFNRGTSEKSNTQLYVWPILLETNINDYELVDANNEEMGYTGKTEDKVIAKQEGLKYIVTAKNNRNKEYNEKYQAK